MGKQDKDCLNKFNEVTHGRSFFLDQVTSMLKKLDHIIAKGNHFSVDENVTQCPVDYTVLSYQEWSRTNPKLHALQSQVLELLNKKTK